MPCPPGRPPSSVSCLGVRMAKYPLAWCARPGWSPMSSGGHRVGTLCWHSGFLFGRGVLQVEGHRRSRAPEGHGGLGICAVVFRGCCCRVLPSLSLWPSLTLCRCSCVLAGVAVAVIGFVVGVGVGDAVGVVVVVLCASALWTRTAALVSCCGCGGGSCRGGGCCCPGALAGWRAGCGDRRPPLGFALLEA